MSNIWEHQQRAETRERNAMRSLTINSTDCNVLTSLTRWLWRWKWPAKRKLPSWCSSARLELKRESGKVQHFWFRWEWKIFNYQTPTKGHKIVKNWLWTVHKWEATTRKVWNEQTKTRNLPGTFFLFFSCTILKCKMTFRWVQLQTTIRVDMNGETWNNNKRTNSTFKYHCLVSILVCPQPPSVPCSSRCSFRTCHIHDTRTLSTLSNTINNIFLLLNKQLCRSFFFSSTNIQIFWLEFAPELAVNVEP